MSIIDSLLIEIGVDASKVSQGIQESRQQVRSFGETLRKMWNDVVDEGFGRTAKKADELLKAPQKPEKPEYKDLPLRPERYTNPDDKADERAENKRRKDEWLKEVDDVKAYNNDLKAKYAEDLKKWKEETKEYNKALKETNRSLKDQEDTYGRLTSRIRDVVAGYMTISTLLKRGAEAVKLRDLSRELRISVEELDTWGRAFTNAGYDANSAYDALGKIKNGLRDVALTGRNETIGMLNYLGVSLRNANGEMKSEGEILVDTAKRLRQLDPGNARRFAEMAGFDRDTINLLLDTKVSLEDVYATAQKGRLSGELAESVKDFQRVWGEFTNALSTFGNIVLKYVVPPAQAVVKAITGILNIINESDTAVIAIASSLALVGSRVLKLGSAFRLLFSPVMLIIGAFRELYKFFTSGDSLIEALLEKLGVAKDTIQAIKDFFSWSPDKTKSATAEVDMWSQITAPTADAIADSRTTNKTSQVQIQNIFNGVDYDNVRDVERVVGKSEAETSNKYAYLTADVGM